MIHITGIVVACCSASRCMAGSRAASAP